MVQKPLPFLGRRDELPLLRFRTATGKRLCEPVELLDLGVEPRLSLALPIVNGRGGSRLMESNRFSFSSPSREVFRSENVSDWEMAARMLVWGLRWSWSGEKEGSGESAGLGLELFWKGVGD
jgi:hypothetical protein